MISAETRAKYTATIGIECHVQFKTATKLFAGVENDAREAEPNTLVSHICFGMPGALPVLNEAAVQLAAKAAFALNSQPQSFSKFDRKHYFYPDLPMGYQITQFDEPIVLGGTVAIEIGGDVRTIGITRAHLEADAGKSTHPTGKDYSLVDLNRAGTPLLEIVSEPDMHTAEEAKAYARELWLIMRYADVSEANLFYGNMRFDVNVSVSQTDKLGTRSETKNLNSFRSVEKAVEYEINRQIELLENGESIVQETRGWDDAKQKTLSQRTKEDAHDYRYFPDPDLPPIVLSEEFIASIKQAMPAMPNEWRERLSSLDLDRPHIETLLEAQIELPDAGYLQLIEAALSDKLYAKQLANWVVNVDIPLARQDQVAHTDRATIYSTVSRLVGEGKLSSTNAKALIADLLKAESLVEDVEKFAHDKDYIQMSDEAAIVEIVKQVLAAHPQAAQDVKNGEAKAIGFLVGQVMKESKGQANPQLAQSLIKRELV